MKKLTLIEFIRLWTCRKVIERSIKLCYDKNGLKDGIAPEMVDTFMDAHGMLTKSIVTGLRDPDNSNELLKVFYYNTSKY